MKDVMNFRGRWVLVTGASSGLGEAMARQLALEQGANLILVARREERLLALKSELESAAGVRCEVIVADLAEAEAVERLYAEATALGDIYGVVLNAGITHFGRHAELGWAQFQRLLAINVTGVVRLMSQFAPYLIAKGQGGGMLVVSSIAGLLPVPYQAAYAGSKGFVTQFSQSLQQELVEENISITVLSPGGIDTEMTHNSGLRYFEHSVFQQDVGTCAREALAAMRARRSLYVPGRLNRLQLFATRFVPRCLVGAITRTAYRRALAQA